ncbi:MAG: alpha/beta hydrolase, partial [Acidimicrobiales bacterium]
MRPENPRAGRRPDGALVLHGLTGTLQSVRGLADAFASAGFTVEAPLLPGHGTTVDELERTDWEDWLGAARAAYRDLVGSCRRVVVAGLSMGGSLACRLASEHPEVAGLVVVNPFIDPPAESFRQVLRQMLDEGITQADGIAGDVADPSVREEGYHQLPLASLLSLCRGLDDLMGRLSSIR